MVFSPPAAHRYWITRASLYAAITQGEGLAPARADGFVTAALLVEDGRIVRIMPEAEEDGAPRFDIAGKIILPRLIDIHTHLDKGHIFPRAANPDGSFMGALTTVMADREKNWSAEDVAARMDFALRCAYHHGTGAIRTHLDSYRALTASTWGVFDAMREAWKDRISLQVVALFPTIVAVEDEAEFKNTLAHVARYNGILGGVTFRGNPPDAALELALDRTIEAAKAHGLDLDFHVDESASPDARSLEVIADALLRHHFTGKVLAGHCCSLALMADEDRTRVTDKLGEAGVAVVSLPMCNLYLQDREAGRTPRWRGVAPLHELDAAGVATMVSSDNTRDPFYAYGDLDGVEVYREATRILHFDHSARPWLEAITSRPADHMRLTGGGRLMPGMAADFIVFSARNMNEFLARPQQDRQVFRAGMPLAAPLPDYAELDGLY